MRPIRLEEIKVLSNHSISSRYLASAVTVLMMVSIVNVADKELLAPVADAVRAELGMNDTQLGMVRSAVFLAALVGQLFWGPLSDRWVRKYIIVIGTILWSAVTWMTAFVTSFPQLLAARAGMSFAEGCFNPSAYSLITDTAPRQRHGLFLGLLSLTYPVGTAAALVIVSLIGSEHWRQPFIIFGGIGILLGGLVFLVIKEPKRGATEESVETAQNGYPGRFSLSEFRQVLAIPSVLLVFALDTCQAAVNWSIAFWAPTYLTRYRIAPDPEAAALALLPAILGFVIGAVLGGWLIDRLRNRTERAAVWVALVSMAGGFLMSFVVFNLFNLAQLMTAAFFLGLIAYMVLPAVSLILFSVVPPETKATSISASNVILNLVIAALSLLIGVFSERAGLRLAFGGVVMVMFAFGIVVCLALLRTIRTDSAHQRARVKARLGSTD